MALALACGSESADPADRSESAAPTTETANSDPVPPREPTNPTPREPSMPATTAAQSLVEVSLPTSKPPFPGYAGSDRCTLIAPLPAAALGLPGPIFQCEMARYLSVDLDGSTRPQDVRIGGASPEPRTLHAVTYGTYRDARAWLGATLLRGSATGLDRWLPAAPPAALDPAQAHVFEPVANLAGVRVAKLVGGARVAWALTDDAVWRVTGQGEGVRAERFFDLADLPRGDAAAPATGDFCRLAPIDDERVMIRHRNFGRNDLFVVDGSGATPLAVPEATAPPTTSPSPPGADIPSGLGEPTGGPMGGPGGGGGGMEPPRVHEPIRVGDRVFVGSADDRLFVFDPASTTLVDVSPEGLRPYGTRNLRPEYADGAPGVALIALGNRLRACGDSGLCVTLETPTDRNYSNVVHLQDRTFLALYAGTDGSGGATLVTLAR